MTWSHLIAAALPAFLASLVEFVEAWTIVLAVGLTRGWNAALAGAAAGAGIVALLIVVLGPALTMVPLAALQFVVGVLLVFFGLRWLRKAVLRAAGVIALHDETRAFEKQRTRLVATTAAARIDAIGFITALKAVVLEGLEVVFIVIAVGATAGALGPASAGAALAGIVVSGAAVAAKAPLARVPENSLKLIVGLMLSAFGTFWIGEGLGARWPGEDLSVLGLILGYGLVAAAGVRAARLRTVRTSAA